MAQDYLVNIDNLLEHQIQPAEDLLNCLRRHPRDVDCSDMGVGKTYVACAMVRELGLPTLVICPKSAIPKWESVGDLMGGEVTAINYERLVRCKTPYGEFFNDRGNMRYRWNPAIKFLIFDEFHRAGGNNTGNCKLVLAAVHQNIRGLGLSATLAENPNRMMAAGYFINLFAPQMEEVAIMTRKGVKTKKLPSKAVSAPFKKWAGKHGCRDGYEGWGFYGGPKDMQKIHRAIFPEKGIRVRIKDIPDFPETQISPELIDFDEDKIQKAYLAMEKEMEVLADKCKDWNPADPMFQKLRERQTIDLLKVPTYLDLTTDAVTEGRSVAMFVPYRATVKALSSRLQIEHSIIWGGQTPTQRQEEIDRFSFDKTRVCLIVNQAGCESIDLHDIRGEFARLSLITPPYEAWLLRQILGRVRRAGGKSKSIQRILCALGTYEEVIYKNLVRKSLNLDALNDHDLDPFQYELKK